MERLKVRSMRRPRRFWLNLLFTFAPPIVLLLGGYSFLRENFDFLNSSPRLASLLSSEITLRLGREVHVRSVLIADNWWKIFGSQKIELRNVAIADLPANSEKPFANIDRIDIDLNLRNIFYPQYSQAPYIDKIFLIHPHVKILREQNGRWNFDKLLKPAAPEGRPTVAKVEFQEAAVDYTDHTFPHLSQANRYSFTSRMEHTDGSIDIRQDGSALFLLVGKEETGFCSDIRATGMYKALEGKLDIKISASEIFLPVLGDRLLSPRMIRFARGSANAEINLSYNTPGALRPLNQYRQLDIRGDINISNVSTSGSFLKAPLDGVSGSGTFSSESIHANLAGNYAHIPVNILGSIRGLNMIPMTTDHLVPKPEVTLDFAGSSKAADFTKIAEYIHSLHIKSLNAETENILKNIYSTGNIEAKVTGPISNISASVTALLPQVNYSHHIAKLVQLQAVLANHTFNTDATGSFAGGTIKVQAGGHWGEKDDFRLTAHGRKLQLAQIPDAAKEQLAGLGQIDIAIVKEGNNPAQAAVQCQAVNLQKGDQHVGMVYARGDTVNHTFNLRELRVEDPRGYLLANGTYQMDTKALDINIDADELQLADLTRAANLLSMHATNEPTYLSDPIQQITKAITERPVFTANIENGLQGVGYLRAKLAGTLDDPMLQGRATAFALEYRKFGLDRFTADFDLSRSALILSQAKANRGSGTLRFTGIETEPFSAKPTLSLTAQADKIDIADLLLSLGVDIGDEAVTGFLSTDAVQLRGSLDRLYTRAPFTVAFDMLSLNGKPVRNASIKGELDDQGFHVDNAGADLAGGRVQLSGAINHDKSLNIRLNGDNIEIQTLLDTLPETFADRLDGSLNFEGVLSGNISKPEFNLKLQAKKLNLNSVSLGSLDLSASAVGSLISVTNLQLKDSLHPSTSAVFSSDMKFNTSSKELIGEIKWTDYPIQRLREIADATIIMHLEKSQKLQDVLSQIAGPIEGSLSGSYSFSGTLREYKGNLNWVASDIRVNSYPISIFSGTAVIDSKSISVARTRLESKEAHFEVDGRDIRMEYEGNIAGDISAYNVDLGFLQKWFTKAENRNLITADVPDIMGKGDFGIVASGKFSSPELEVSVNLSNVAVLHPRNISPLAITPLIATSVTAPSAKKILLRSVKDLSKLPDTAAILSAQTIDHIDIYGATIKEGAVAGNIHFVKKGDGTPEHPNLDLSASGSMGFSWTSPFITKDSPLDFQAGTSTHPGLKLSLNEIAELFRVIALNSKSDASLNKTRTEGSEGSLILNAALKGTARKPKFSGQLALDIPKLRLTDLSEGLTDISGTLALNGNYIFVSPDFKLKAHLFNTNASKIVYADVPVTLKGRLPIVQTDGEIPNPEDGLTLSAPSIAFNQTPLPSIGSGSIRGTAGIQLKVDGSLQQPILGGYIAVHDAFASLPSDMSTGDSLFVEPLIDPRFKNLHLRLDRNVRMVNSQLNALVRGDIGFTGSLSQPQLQGTLILDEGKLKLPTAVFTILPPGTLRLIYPVADTRNFDSPTLGLDVDLRAKTTLSAASISGVRRRYNITVTAHGPITGDVTDPLTGESLLALNFQSDPPDLASDQQSLNQRLTGIIGGGDTISLLSRNSGQVLASQLANAFKGSIIPGFFEKSAAAFGFEEISLDYDPVTRLNFTATTKIFNPFYISYYRSLSGFQNVYDLKISLRFKDRYQLSFDTNEQRTSQFLLEGVFRF